jgi:hypothetical protein
MPIQFQMKKKKYWVAIVFIILSFLVIQYAPPVRSEIILFDHVNVLLIGRCRTIGSDGTWLGGLYRGFLPYADITTTNTSFERVLIIVYNESILYPWTSFSGYPFADVGFRNTTGNFFWGAKGFCVRTIPPRIFIHCYAEEFGISTDY